MDLSEKIFFSDLLQRFRKRKQLTQKQLAERIGVRRESVSFWERGQYVPEIVMLHELARVLNLDEDEKRLLFEAHSGTASMLPLHNLPTERNPYFTGREEVLHSLHESLRAGKQVTLTQAISGLGGIGKTQVALEYVYRYREHYHDILWATADAQETLLASYIELAKRLHLREREEKDQNKVVEAVKRWLREHKGWLLVLDNVEDLHLVVEFIPMAGRQGAVVLTTRQQVTEPMAQTIELDVLSDSDGALFLLKRTKRLALDGLLDKAIAEEISVAQRISQALGGLPLALDQAGAYILETGCGLDAYLDLFQQRWGKLLQQRGKVPTEHSQSVTTTFTLAFDRVQERSEVAINLLKLCAFLAPDAIAEEIFVEGASGLEPLLQSVVADPLRFNEIIEILRTFSLIRRDPIKRTFSIHRLVQAIIIGKLGQQEHQQWMTCVIEALNIVFPDLNYNMFQQKDGYDRLIPHVQLCLSVTASWQTRYLTLAALLIRAAYYLYHERGQFKQPELYYQRALYILENALGPEHPEMVPPLQGLGYIYLDQSKYVEAESHYQQALRIREKALGPEDALVAFTHHGLGNIYHVQGKYVEAESHYQQALRIREKALGPEDALVAFPLQGLANTYYSQGKYTEAELLYQRVLYIWEQALGLEHPEMAGAFSNLANVKREQGKYAEAELLYQRALYIWEHMLGSEHRFVAEPLNGLANIYYKQGKYEQAELFYQRTLQIRKHSFGYEHAKTAETCYDFAQFQHIRGNVVEAELLYKHVLVFREQFLGSQHPKTQATLEHFATFLRETGRSDEAAALEARFTKETSKEAASESEDV